MSDMELALAGLLDLLMALDIEAASDEDWIKMENFLERWDALRHGLGFGNECPREVQNEVEHVRYVPMG